MLSADCVLEVSRTLSDNDHFPVRFKFQQLKTQFPGPMKRHLLSFITPTAAAVLMLATSPSQGAEKTSWEVAAGGNLYMTEAGQGDGIGRGGRVRWANPESVLSFHFHVGEPVTLDLALKAQVESGSSEIAVRVGENVRRFTLETGGDEAVPLGSFDIEEAGHVRVDLRGVSRDGSTFARPEALVVSAENSELPLAFVRTSAGNRFYWGRRGPSVHLNYPLPRGRNIEWSYSEIEVPVGEDPIGSYFMANGFGQGYFGIQVNSPTERRVLFSVWSPYHTDNPADIPEDQRVLVLGRGEGVRTGEFGNEGSGGQSFMLYPWEAGKTYRFLTRIHPDGEGNTIYSAWFGSPDSDHWKYIATFQRPKTDTWLTGFHSFLENFHTGSGDQFRRAWHGNQWVRDTDGEWHEITRTRFTGDDIARRGYRLDFAGGVEGHRFFMANGGFTNLHTPLNSTFERDPSPDGPPAIDLEALPQRPFNPE